MAERHAFVTGFPGFIARRFVPKLLASDDSVRVTVLAESAQHEAATAAIREIEAHSSTGFGARVRLLSGDVTAMDVGLSGPEFRDVIEQTTEVIHLAAVHRLGVERHVAERVNVVGTRNMLELARGMKQLERFVHFSSAYVSGNRQGVVLEEELDCGQDFRNAYESTKHRAEALVRDAMSGLPITVIRPSAVVGDSRTGEVSRIDGIYTVGILLAASPVPIPLPGQGSAPLNLVPVDYLIDAVHAITERADSIGKTFHVVDPNPLSVRHVYDRVADAMGRAHTAPRYGLSPNLTKALLRIPRLERIAPLSHEFVDYLNTMVFYNSRNTADALEGSGLRCPPFDSYVQNLIRYVRDTRATGDLPSPERPTI